MAKYFVQVNITVHYDYELEVEACDEETAIDKAEQIVYDETNPDMWDYCEQEVEVWDIHEEEKDNDDS